jgi:hypothetical protein
MWGTKYLGLPTYKTTPPLLSPWSFTTSNFFLAAIMTSSFSPQLVLRASRRAIRRNGFRSGSCSIRRRYFADVADSMALPLKGYKVLDMTRVLAGVSNPNTAGCLRTYLYSLAILYADTGGSRVRRPPLQSCGYVLTALTTGQR